MEKIKNFILKTPVVMAIITFLSACFVSIFNTDFLGMKYMSIEKTLAPTALLFCIFYGHTFKEQIPKEYRIKYSLYTSFLYILFNLFNIYYSTDISVLSLSYTSIIVSAPLFCLVIYFLSGAITQSYSNGDYEKMVIAQKNMPIQIQKKRRFLRYALNVAIFLPIILFVLINKNIIHFDKNVEILLPLLFLFIVIFIIAKYLRKMTMEDIISSQEDKE